jgi:hypothetical protein
VTESGESQPRKTAAIPVPGSLPTLPQTIFYLETDHLTRGGSKSARGDAAAVDKDSRD